jgi:prepilin-type N-terminal cleavage/methylation domain-containing protein
VIKRIKGFTLIELLIALSIFAVIAVVLHACFRGGAVSYRRVSDEVDSQQGLRYLLLKIEKDIKNAFFMVNAPFEGDEARVSFTSLITDAEDAPINAGRVSYYLRQVNDGYALIRRIESLQEALAFSLTGYDTGEQVSPGSPRGREETIAEDISRIRFTYLHAEKQQPVTGTGEDAETDAGKGRISYQWLDIWEKNTLPLAVKVEILFSSLSNIGPRQVIKSVWVPSAGCYLERVREELI